MPKDVSGPQSDSSNEVEFGRTEQRPERADAVRNRRRILAAAAQLFAERGVDAVSLDAIAAAAGVGKGTVFRRFGDKSGLAIALLDERERDLQQALIYGEPPLGPGAPPSARAAAFTRAYLGYVLETPELVRMSETASPGARFRIGAFGFWHAHLRILLTEAGQPPVRAAVLAHALLAPLAAEHVLAQLASGVSLADLIDGLVRHAELVVGSDPSAAGSSEATVS